MERKKIILPFYIKEAIEKIKNNTNSSFDLILLKSYHKLLLNK